MRRVLTIAKLNLVELSRDRGAMVSAVVLPLLLTWVFSTAFGSSGVERAVDIPVANADASAYSAAIVKGIDDASAYNVKPVAEEEARRLVSEGDAPVAVIIADGFGAAIDASKTASVAVLRYPGSSNAVAAAQVVQGAVSRVSANVEAARSATQATAIHFHGPLAQTARLRDTGAKFAYAYEHAAGLWEPAPPVGVKVTVATAAGDRGSSAQVPANIQYSIGFTIFFVFMTALGSAGGVLEERELGTLRRLLAAPLRRAEILGGKVLGVAAVAGAQAALLVAVGALFFGVPWGQDPLAVAVLLLSLVLAATGIGVMISALVRTRGQMSALSPIVSTALAMLGGCYWDLELTSPTMQKIAMLTPTGWAVVGFKDVVARGAGLSGVAVPVTVLLGFASVSLLVGITRLRLE